MLFRSFKVNPGDFFIGDECGVVVIPQELFAKTMVGALGVKIKELNIINKLSQGATLSEIAVFEKK